MPWARLDVRNRAIRRRSRLHLDESVPAPVARTLREMGYRPSASSQQRLDGHEDADQAAFCWRERRAIVTFDLGFLEPRGVPLHRTPGTVIIDCDRRHAANVATALAAFGRFDGLFGPVARRTRIIVRADSQVNVWTTASARQAPNFRYRLANAQRPFVWTP